MADLSQQADVLRGALPGSSSFFDVYSRIREAVPEGEELAYRGLIWAFAYDFLLPDDEESRAREQGPYGAMFEFDGKRLPPRLQDIEADDLAVWASLFEMVTEPPAAARLGDLLWERRYGPRPDQAARAACRAFLELAAEPEWGSMESTHGLVRASELAAAVRDEGLQASVVDAITEVAAEEIASDEDRPGISITLLELLVDTPREQQPEQLRDLVERAQTKHGDDPHLFQALHDLKVELATPDDRRSLRVEQVEKWREAAAKADGILRASFLQTALDLARAHGLTTQADQLRVELGSMSEEDLGLKEISAETRIDRAELDRFISQFVVEDDWRTSLTRFGAHGPPGGEPADLDEEVERQRQATPFQFLVSQLIVDPDTGSPLFRAEDDESKTRAFRAQQRLFAARIWGVLGVDVLQRIVEQAGWPTRGELTEFFTQGVIDVDNAARVARAFDLYWNGEPDLAAHLLAPRLEAILRELARQLGVPVFDEPVGSRPGRVRALGRIMRALEGRMPSPGWHAYLTILLSDPLGLNLRNVVAHGLRPEIAQHDTALLLQVACFLRLVVPQHQADAPDDA